MYQPQSYGIALAFMICTMLCWGSWANTLKLAPGYRFQLFYWDYVLGMIAAAAALGFTLGSFGDQGSSFILDVSSADGHHTILAVAGGVVFNIANLLLVAAIEIAGLAVAFPIGIGLALVVGAGSSYFLAPKGNPLLLFGGIALVVGAIFCDAVAYREREMGNRQMSRRGVVISLVAGLLMGTFYPLVSSAMDGDRAPGPYATALFFALGVALCTIPLNYFLMRKPLDGSDPITMRSYKEAKLYWHVWGGLGGAIWCLGATLNFVASRTAIVGPAVSYTLGQGATLVSACWGVFVWREFASAPRRSKKLLAWMFLLFCIGLTSVAIAPCIR
jgi:glucose uptake protein